MNRRYIEIGMTLVAAVLGIGLLAGEGALIYAATTGPHWLWILVATWTLVLTFAFNKAIDHIWGDR